MRIFIGTSGFQYPEWKGGFYPEVISAAKMLPYYAERFTSTESNYSFRHLPSAKSIANWAKLTPPYFRFSFKAPQRVTHFAKLVDCADKMSVFHHAIAPMGERLGAVLFQLPATFRKNTEVLRDFLETLPSGLRAAFEFRDASWFCDEVYDTLRKAGAALCLAENEELATPPVATAGFGYLRLRREDYRPADLKRWAALVSEQEGRWGECFIYFKHEERGVGPKFGAAMARLLNAAPAPAAKRGSGARRARAE